MANNKILQIVALNEAQIIAKYPEATNKDRLILSLDTSKIWVDIAGERYCVANLGISTDQSQLLKQDIQTLKQSIGIINTQLTQLVGE